jgi:hypothetical protein
VTGRPSDRSDRFELIKRSRDGAALIVVPITDEGEGVVDELWGPRGEQQAWRATSQMTAGKSEEMFERMDSMSRSRAASTGCRKRYRGGGTGSRSHQRAAGLRCSWAAPQRYVGGLSWGVSAFGSGSPACVLGLLVFPSSRAFEVAILPIP